MAGIKDANRTTYRTRDRIAQLESENAKLKAAYGALLIAHASAVMALAALDEG